jgi:Glycosyltransferase like family 2
VDDGDNGDLHQILRGLPAEIIPTGGTGSAAVARNPGALDFEGDFLVFVDSDVMVDRFCIAKLLEPLKNRQAEATVGNYSQDVAGATFASRYKQLYISRIYGRRSGYLQNDYWTAAAAINAQVFRSLNGFDTGFPGACGEDGELGGRLTQGGYRIQAVSGAIANHRNNLSLWQLLRNDWRKGLIAMRNYLHFDGSISDNRHATPRDVFAVLVAVAAVLLPPFAFRLGYPVAVASAAEAVLVAGYLTARADLLRVFASQGAWFLVRASCLMCVLDLVRLTCVGAGLGLRFAQRFFGPSKHRSFPAQG